MTSSAIAYLFYAAPLIAIWLLYLRKRSRQQTVSVEVLEESIEAGLTEPASLHPIIDPLKCIGCGSCVAACPEMPKHQVLGMVRRKAALVSPTDCIGHGACKTACPVDAISLVFGTERRGMDIPNISPTFETNIPGMFIAGELGGMGLIRNAIEQGSQAIKSIKQHVAKQKGNGDYDVLIIGAGPTGIAASLAAKEIGLSYVTLEQDSLGGTVAQFPRRKLVMTSPATLPLVGKMKFTETTKETLIEFWQQVECEHQLKIRYGEHVERIDRAGVAFDVTSGSATYSACTVLLAIGRGGTPRKLGVPGEELSKVLYRLVDPAQFCNLHVLVVGGGDSALESAITISEEPGTTVTLSYRSAAFSRAKKKNRLKVEAAQQSGQLNVMLESTVTEIGAKYAKLDVKGDAVQIENDAIIVNAGGILPTAFLKEIGIEVETKYGTA